MLLWFGANCGNKQCVKNKVTTMDHPGGHRGRGRARGLRSGGRGRGKSVCNLDPLALQEGGPTADAGPPGPLRQTDPADPPEPVFIALNDQLKKVSEAPLTNKNKMSHLKKNLLKSLVEAKEISTFIKPEFPERKQKRLAATLTTNTSPVQPVEETSGKQMLTPRKKIRLITPSTGIKITEEHDMQNIELHEVHVELIGFTPISSPATPSLLASTGIGELGEMVADHPSGFAGVPPLNASTGIFDDTIEPESWERTISEDGSDNDINDDDEGNDIGVRRRNAEEFPAVIQDHVSENLLSQLQAMDDQDDAALRQIIDNNNDMLNFNWKNDAGVFVGTREEFAGPAGPTFSTDKMAPIDIFEKIWDREIIGLIVRETNRYATNLIEGSELKPISRLKRWQNIKESDVWIFFGIIMLQSLLPNPVEKHYWYPSLPYLKIGNFNDIMPLNTFMLIKKFLHFVNYNARGGDNKLKNIQPIIDHLNTKFSSLYLPEQCIAIDESLLLWKGRLSFPQLIATKAARVGIKSYELCESRTGYLWRMLIYTGKGHTEVTENGDDKPEGATSQIVFKLVRPLLDKGHTLVMDNFYNSPLLSRALKQRKTDTMGTLRLNREFVPNSLRELSNNDMRTGEVAFSQTVKTVVVWKDNDDLVSLISSYHPVEVGGKERFGYYKYKPKVVLDYNQAMGGLDKKDQLLQAFPVERVRNCGWYKKLFRRLLNVSMLNASVIYNANRKVGMSQRQFRETLADQIIKKYGGEQRLTPEVQLTRNHFPARNEGKARCKWCAKNKVASRTVYKCEACDVALCILDCFKKYHLRLQSQVGETPG